MNRTMPLFGSSIKKLRFKQTCSYKSRRFKTTTNSTKVCTSLIDVTAIRLQETVSLDTLPKPRSTMHGLRNRPCFVDHCGKLSSTMAKATPSRKNDFYAIQTSQKDAEDNDENPQCMTSFSRPKPSKLGQSNISMFQHSRNT